MNRQEINAVQMRARTLWLEVQATKKVPNYPTELAVKFRAATGMQIEEYLGGALHTPGEENREVAS